MTTKRKFKPKTSNYKIMGKSEYLAARIWLGLSDQEFADLIGIKLRQDQYFRAGQCAVPETLAKLIRTVIDHKIPPDEVGRVR